MLNELLTNSVTYTDPRYKNISLTRLSPVVSTLLPKPCSQEGPGFQPGLSQVHYLYALYSLCLVLQCLFHN